MDNENSTKTLRKKKVKRRFFVSASRFKFEADGLPLIDVDKDTSHHIRTVLRLSKGARVIVFDNSGKEYEGEIISSKPSGTTVKAVSASVPLVESPVNITLAQSLPRGNSFDGILTRCTELGCSRFVPLFTSRTVARLKKSDAADRIKRWERIVAESAAQSDRVKVPRIEMPMDFDEFLEKKRDGKKIILWEKGGSGQLKQIVDEEPQKIESVVLLAGPEGGFSQVEVKTANDDDYKILGLGPRKLKAETAGAAAISIIQFILGDMG